MSTMRTATPGRYEAWRQERLAARLAASPAPPDAWNHLITVVAFGGESGALCRTLESLRAQTYRNIEILSAGHDAAALRPAGDFASLRGLFAEPALDPLAMLSDPATEALWRGSHLLFAPAGTTFDADAFALLNAALTPENGAAAPDLVLSDHDRTTEGGPEPILLPGWDPDLVGAMDVVGTAFLASRRLVRARRGASPWRSLHDWLRGIAEARQAPRWVHLSEPVIHLPDPPPPPPEQPAAPAIGGTGPSLGIVIPTRDRPDLLGRCVAFLDSLDLPAVELVIVDHASRDPEALALQERLRTRQGARILHVGGGFNFARMINLGVAAMTADIALLMNNDIEVTRPGQIERLVAHAARPEVGAAGARLLDAEGRVQHGGVILERGPDAAHPTVARHVHRGAAQVAHGHLHALRTVRNWQAVTGALVATRREVFDAVEGFDEMNLPVEFNDVDYCLKVRALGLRVVTVPTEGILHRESATRGDAPRLEELRMRMAACHLMRARWPSAVHRDPFRNPWVTLGDVPEARFPWSEGAAT